MLYLNSIANQASSPGLKVAIGRDRFPEMQSVPELFPSVQLQVRFEAGEINWQEYHDLFLKELRQEYAKPQSRLKRMALYSLRNDVTLHSADPYTDSSVRSILKEVVNGIWKSMGENMQVTDLAPSPPESDAPAQVTEPTALQRKLASIASGCEHFSRHDSEAQDITCEICQHYDALFCGCPVVEKVFITYHWEQPEGIPT